MYCQPNPKSYFYASGDTHMQHEKLSMPDGDVLIHSGDFTNHGSLSEVREFAAWLTTLSYKYIIIVPGNHGWLKHYLFGMLY